MPKVCLLSYSRLVLVAREDFKRLLSESIVDSRAIEVAEKILEQEAKLNGL